MSNLQKLFILGKTLEPKTLNVEQGAAALNANPTDTIENQTLTSAMLIHEPYVSH